MVLLLACLAATAVAHASMDTSSAVGRGEIFVPKPEQARLSTLGFDSLVADYYWLSAVQLVGAAHSDVGGQAPLLGRLVDVSTTIDPWFGHPYRFAAVWLTDSIESVRQANALLERGIAYHPKDWRNRHYLGFNHFYYLLDDARAADILETAVGLEGAPPYLASLVAKLRMGEDGLGTSATFLQQLVAATEDPFATAEYEKALDEIYTERRARRLDRARARYRERFGRDIERPEELWEGSEPILAKQPSAHPHLPGFGWEIHEDTGEIVSSFYGARYRPYVHPLDRERRDRWRKQLEAEAG